MINFYKKRIIWEYRFFLKVFRNHIKKPEKLEDKMEAILFFWKIAKINKYYRIYNFRCNRRASKELQKMINLLLDKIIGKSHFLRLEERYKKLLENR